MCFFAIILLISVYHKEALENTYDCYLQALRVIVDHLNYIKTHSKLPKRSGRDVCVLNKSPLNTLVDMWTGNDKDN